jgi:hypothetical protein
MVKETDRGEPVHETIRVIRRVVFTAKTDGTSYRKTFARHVLG